MKRLFKLFRDIAIFAMVLLLLSGCSLFYKPATDVKPTAPPAAAAPESEPVKTPKPDPLFFLPQIDSSTARIPITQAIYELFTGTYNYGGPEPICSKTHGAWLNLADGAADIIFLVAPTEEELAYFTEKGVDIEMKIYGFDGLVFIGNESNPVNNLTSEQVRDIYSGVIDDWNMVGGEWAGIDVYIRNPESGSQRLFESLVWAGYDMPDFSSLGFKEGDVNPDVPKVEYEFYDDMADVTESVILNQYSIGFNIMSYIDSEFSNAPLKLFSIDGYAPTTENFASGKYPYLTTSYVVIRADEPEDSPARKLYNWIGSDESYALIAANSTLSVSFSEPVVIRTCPTDPQKNEAMANVIETLAQKPITREIMHQFTLEEIGYLRNGIFALSGKIFSTPKYKSYFGSKSWYVARSESDDAVTKTFNDIQWQNLNIIRAYENELKRAMGVK